jgi:hypothetical protein
MRALLATSSVMYLLGPDVSALLQLSGQDYDSSTSKVSSEHWNYQNSQNVI